MNLLPSVSLADQLSLSPVTQQGVGVCTVVSNLFKLIWDIVKSIFFWLWENPAGYEQAKKDFSRHRKFIGVGLIRLTPILGSIYSLRRIQDTEREVCKQVKNAQREIGAERKRAQERQRRAEEQAEREMKARQQAEEAQAKAEEECERAQEGQRRAEEQAEREMKARQQAEEAQAKAEEECERAQEGQKQAEEKVRQEVKVRQQAEEAQAKAEKETKTLIGNWEKAEAERQESEESVRQEELGQLALAHVQQDIENQGFLWSVSQAMENPISALFSVNLS